MQFFENDLLRIYLRLLLPQGIIVFAGRAQMVDKYMVGRTSTGKTLFSFLDFIFFGLFGQTEKSFPRLKINRYYLCSRFFFALLGAGREILAGTF